MQYEKWERHPRPLRKILYDYKFNPFRTIRVGVEHRTLVKEPTTGRYAVLMELLELSKHLPPKSRSVVNEGRILVTWRDPKTNVLKRWAIALHDAPKKPVSRKKQREEKERIALQKKRAEREVEREWEKLQITCPHCNRTFKDLKRHIEKRHAGETISVDANYDI